VSIKPLGTAHTNRTECCRDSGSLFTLANRDYGKKVGGIPPADDREMTITSPMIRASKTKAFRRGRPVVICTLACLLFFSASGPATLPPFREAVVPPAEVPPPSQGPDISPISFARGIDISRSAGEPTLQDFENIRRQGYRFVIVNGWGGVHPNGHACVQLSRARSAGLLTAGYCFLNFASAFDGGRQIREALAAFGDESAHVGFLAIDVETSSRNQLSPGLQLEPPDPVAQRQAATRITEAIQEVQRAGLNVVIYTKKDDWQRVTGDIQHFSNLPLWHPKTIGGDDLKQPDLADPGCTFGGWTTRTGKQYALDTVLDSPSIQVDLNIFDLRVFSAGGSNPLESAGLRVAASD